MKKYKLLKEYATPMRNVPIGTIIESASGRPPSMDSYTYIHNGLPVTFPVIAHIVESTPDWFELVEEKVTDPYRSVVVLAVNMDTSIVETIKEIKEKFIVIDRKEVDSEHLQVFTGSFSKLTITIPFGMSTTSRMIIPGQLDITVIKNSSIWQQ